MDILIAIIATYILINYIFPIFDLLFEYYKYFISDKATKLQISAQKQVKEFEEEFPEVEELSPAIGFRMEQPESEFEEDEDCEGKMTNKTNKTNKNIIGFHK